MQLKPFDLADGTKGIRITLDKSERKRLARVRSDATLIAMQPCSSDVAAKQLVAAIDLLLERVDADALALAKPVPADEDPRLIDLAVAKTDPDTDSNKK